MPVSKKDQSRTEIALIVTFILLSIVVIGRLFGPELMTFFFGAGSSIEVVGTEREKELKELSSGKEGAEGEKEEGEAETAAPTDIQNIDPSLYGDEEALAQLQYERELEKRKKLQRTILWVSAFIVLIVVLGLIGWKTYTIIKEIKVKEIE